MSVKSIDLSSLKDCICNLGQIDVLKLNGIEIWNRNKNVSSIKFVQSNLLTLPDDGNTGVIKDIVAFKGNLVVVKGSSLYHTSDFENWTTVILQGTPNLIRICNNKLFYGKGDYVYYTDDLINFVALPKFSGSATNDAFFELYYDEKENKYRFWEYYYRHDSSDLASWTRNTIGESANQVKNVSTTYFDGQYHYSVPMNKSSYYYLYSSLSKNSGTPLTATAGSGYIWKFTENQTGSFVMLPTVPNATFLFNRGTLNVSDSFEKLTLPSKFRMVLGVNGIFCVVHETGACKINEDFSGYEEIEIENFTSLSATTSMLYCEDKDNKCIYVLNEDNTGVYKLELKGDL